MAAPLKTTLDTKIETLPTVIPAEMVKEHNDIYKLLGIKPAKEYPIKKRPNV